MKFRRETFYKDFVRSLEEGNAAVFAGAGLSKPAGMVDWKELLREIAEDLGLRVDKENDLLALAQYHKNQFQSRHKIEQSIMDAFAKDAKITENHELLVKLKLASIWTTNYDTVLEEAHRKGHKKFDLKVVSSQLAVLTPNREVAIYKMHGDINNVKDAVITKHDYINYRTERGEFADALKGDLIFKRFLFLGFSFTDPNIDFILSRVHRAFGESRPSHYCIMRRPQQSDYVAGQEKGKPHEDQAEWEYDTRKFELRCDDLAQYGVHVLAVDDHKEITGILREVHRRAYAKEVFVSGSAHDYQPLGANRVETLCRRLGSEIIKRGLNLINGFGLGIGGAVISGAFGQLYREEQDDPARRTLLRPFPQGIGTDEERKQFYESYRRDMISRAGYCVILCGNKQDPKGQVIEAGGVIQEFEIAHELGKHVIPVGCTGYAAQALWERVTSDLATFYPGVEVANEFQVLGDPNQSEDKLIEAIFAIIDKTRAARR